MRTANNSSPHYRACNLCEAICGIVISSSRQEQLAGVMAEQRACAEWLWSSVRVDVKQTVSLRSHVTFHRGVAKNEVRGLAARCAEVAMPFRLELIEPRGYAPTRGVAPE